MGPSQKAFQTKASWKSKPKSSSRNVEADEDDHVIKPSNKFQKNDVDMTPVQMTRGPNDGYHHNAADGKSKSNTHLDVPGARDWSPDTSPKKYMTSPCSRPSRTEDSDDDDVDGEAMD